MKQNVVKALALFALLLPAPLVAQPVAVPASQAQVKLSFAPVVKSVAPAVVNIYTSSRITVMDSPFMNDPFFQQFFGGRMPGMPREQVVSSLGSGVIISDSGMIVTSHHVIRDAQEIRVVLADKREFAATVTLKDPKADLAFLSIKAEGKLPFVALRDSDTLEVGELVLAIGNPFGVGQTVTSGIVSALARRAEGVSDYSFFIQTDAAINPGNSGGALVDMEGKLVGINTAIYSKSGGSLGIGFAIPANMVASLQGQKGEGGTVVRPWLGMSGQSVTPEIAESLGMKTPRGVLIDRLHPASPAALAGIKSGDVVLTVNGIEITGVEDLQYRLALAKLGATGEFEVMRAGKTQRVEVPYIAAPETPAREERVLAGRHPLSGLAVANLSPALALEIGLPDTLTGVVVLGRAQQTGLDIGIGRGDIVLEINGTKINSVATLEKALAAKTGKWAIAYQRGQQVMTLNVSMR